MEALINLICWCVDNGDMGRKVTIVDGSVEIKRDLAVRQMGL